MTATILITRPEPGASATASRLDAMGLPAQIAPLFALEPLAWTPPPSDAFDGLLLTSANAVRHGGTGLAVLHRLPAWCVGAATAEAAAAAGLTVAQTGTSNAADLIDAAPRQRWLWLRGEVHQPLEAPQGSSLTAIAVYASQPLAPTSATLAALAGPCIVMAYSAAAATRLTALVADPALHRLVAISPAVASAAGHGWAEVVVARRPEDGEMVALAATLCKKAAHG